LYSDGAPGALRGSRPYFDDPYTTSFEASVSARRDDERGHWVALDRSFFYPEGGGQESDRGTLSGTDVLDVQEDEEGEVWHLVAGAIPDAVEARIDAARRHSNRRQHTGQHILSQAFLRLLEVETVSSRLGGDVGTIDLARPSLTWEEVERVEREANRVAWEDRPVMSRLVDAAQLEREALRRLPKVEGLVRLVEVTDWDLSPCGGTHCTRTGEVGLIKVRRWEKNRGGVRLEFVCGDRALADYQRRVRALSEVAARRNTGEAEVLDVLDRAAGERDGLRKQVKRLTEELAQIEGRLLAQEHKDSGEVVLCRVFDDRPPDGLRALCRALTAAGAERVVLAARAPSPLVLVGRPRGAGDSEDLRAWLPLLIFTSRGKGGGGADELQVTAADGLAAEVAAEKLAAQWRERITAPPEEAE
jgi:alanyl-tRNA synthetase